LIESPPKVDAILGQNFLPKDLTKPFSIIQGDQISFTSKEQAVFINYCIEALESPSYSTKKPCNPEAAVATNVIDLPKSGQWMLRYYASDLAGNRTTTTAIPFYVRQTRDIRRIKNDLISSGLTVNDNQKATFESLSSMVDTYYNLESEIDKQEALDFINTYLTDLSPKIRELARLELDFEVSELIGRPDSDYFAIKIKQGDLKTIVLDKNLNTIKTYSANGSLKFLDKDSWYFYDSNTQQLSFHKSDGSHRLLNIPYDLISTKMVISKNLKYLASKGVDRKLVVIDLDNQKKIFEYNTNPLSISFNLRFNEASTHLYMQQSNGLIRFNLKNLGDISTYEHDENSIIIDLKIHTRKNKRDVALLSTMYTSAEARNSTGLFGLIWDRDKLDQSNLINLNKDLINSNDEPYYGVLMEQNDDPYNPIVYFFNYYSKYTYEANLDKEDFGVTRLEIPIPEPDIDNRVASRKLKDNELATLQSRIYIEQLRANAPYTYDPYPYVYGEKAILISEGERIVVLTEGHIEIRSVYTSLREQIGSDFFKNNPKQGFTLDAISPENLRNLSKKFLALPQIIGTQQYIFTYDSNLKVYSKLKLPSEHDLISLSWGDHEYKLLTVLRSNDGYFSVVTYDIRTDQQLGEIYRTQNEITKLYSYSSSKKSFLIVEKLEPENWRIIELNLRGNFDIFDGLSSKSKLEIFDLDENPFCVAVDEKNDSVRCYKTEGEEIINNNLRAGINRLIEKNKNIPCKKSICSWYEFSGSKEDLMSELSNISTQIGSNQGSISLNPAGRADIFGNAKNKLLSISNVQSIGDIGNKYWYAFSTIGYLSIGDYKTQDPILDLKPGYITERRLWDIDYSANQNKVTFMFVNQDKYLQVESFYLDTQKNVKMLEEWISSHIEKTK
jgi:hypothetical protein